MIRGSGNVRSRLAEDDIHQIRRMLQKSIPKKTIAELFGVTVQNIRAIESGRIWSWLHTEEEPMSTLTPTDAEYLEKYDREAQRSLSAKNLTGVHRYLTAAGNILRSADDHDSVWYGWKARFMAHHEAAGRLAEELENARQQHEQQQRRDIEARGRHRGTMPMADPTTMRMARQHGCRGCGFAKLMKSTDGRVSHAECHVDPPRTSSTAWPAGDLDDFCGRWMAVGEPAAEPVNGNGEPSVAEVVAKLEALPAKEPTPEELVAAQVEEQERRLGRGKEQDGNRTDDNAPEGAGGE